MINLLLALSIFIFRLPILKFIQLKDYRWSRIKAHFYLPSSRHLFLNFKELIIIFLAGLALLLNYNSNQLIATSFSLFLIALAYRWSYLFKIKFTLKVFIISLLTVLTNYTLLFLSTNKFFAFFLLIIFPIQLIILSFWSEIIYHLTKLLSYPWRQKIKRKVIEAKKRGTIFIIVVGSYGKSSTKYFLNQLLSKISTVKAPPDRVNQEFALIKYFLKEDIKEKFVVIEVGGYAVNEVKWVTRFLIPDIVIITGITEQHLVLFGNIENIIKGEGYEVLDNLETGKIVVVNENHPYRDQLLTKIQRRKDLKVITYGLPSSHYSFEIIKIDIVNLTTKINFKARNKIYSLEVPTIVPMQIENLTGALALLNQYFDLETILPHVKDLKILEKSLSLTKSNKGFLIVDASYNANVWGCLRALDFLKKLNSFDKKIVIFNGLIELGKEAEKFYKMIAEQASFADLFISTFSDYNKILKDILQDKFIFTTEPKEMNLVINTFPKSTIILILGRFVGKFANYIIK